MPAPPEDVFTVLTSAEEHSRFTGAKSEINAQDGGRFSYLDGKIEGSFESVTRPAEIVQKLRSQDWPKGVEATVRQELSPQAEGARTFVRVYEFGLPKSELDNVINGWSVYRVTDGLISEVWSEPDLLGIMVQIGAVQMPGEKD